MLYPFSMHLFTKSFRKVSCQRVSQNSFNAEDELKGGIPRSKLHLCLVVVGCTLMGFLGGLRLYSVSPAELFIWK